MSEVLKKGSLIYDGEKFSAGLFTVRDFSPTTQAKLFRKLLHTQKNKEQRAAYKKLRNQKLRDADLPVKTRSYKNDALLAERHAICAQAKKEHMENLRS